MSHAELDRVDWIEEAIKERLGSVMTGHSGPYANLPVIDSYTIAHEFNAMKDRWEWGVYPRVGGKKFRMDGYVNSEDLFSRFAADIVMAGFFEFLLTMQTEYWADWCARRDSE